MHKKLTYYQAGVLIVVEVFNFATACIKAAFALQSDGTIGSADALWKLISSKSLCSLLSGPHCLTTDWMLCNT